MTTEELTQAIFDGFKTSSVPITISSLINRMGYVYGAEYPSIERRIRIRLKKLLELEMVFRNDKKRPNLWSLPEGW